MTEAPGPRLYVGLMSGTSADGLDAALVCFDNASPEILGHRSITYPETLRRRIRDAASAPQLDAAEVMRLDRELGELAAAHVVALLADTHTPPGSVAAIGSHGQTIRHLPEDACTWQIGDPNRIVQQTGITTVADFRRRDLAAQGEGAPLAPAFHAAVFRSKTRNRAILNLGGIANITHLPADHAKPVTGYDTGPANRLLDHWVYLHRREPFDAGGTWAQSGQCNAGLLESFLADPYFSMAPPKSTGPEYFSAAWLDSQLAHHPEVAPADVQATLLQLTVHSVRQEVDKLDPQVEELYVCGGGAENGHLMEQLAEALAPVPVADTSALQVPPGLVEPVAFAWLAQRTLMRQAGNLPSVTGANDSVILGGIYPA